MLSRMCTFDSYTQRVITLLEYRSVKYDEEIHAEIFKYRLSLLTINLHIGALIPPEAWRPSPQFIPLNTTPPILSPQVGVQDYTGVLHLGHLLIPKLP